MYDRVYANGPTGTELAEVARSLQRHLAATGGFKFSYAIVEKRLGVDLITYLDSDDYYFQESEWTRALSSAQGDLLASGSQVSMLMTNAPYFRKGRFFPPAAVRALDGYSPKAVITFIEEGHLAWARIRRREERQRSRSIFRLRDMFIWRSVSTLHAATVARYFGIPHFVFPVKQSASDLQKLLEGSALKVYLSFPMSHVRDNPRALEEINEFRALMHREFCAFDPAAADDRAPQNAYLKAKREGRLGDSVRVEEGDRWPRPEVQWMEPLVGDYIVLGQRREPAYPIEIPADQVREVAEPGGEGEPSEIDRGILQRDVAFVLQSDVVVAYRPNYGGKLSVGSYFEMNYAANVAKKRIFVYWDYEEDGDPMSTPFMGFGTFFDDLDKLVEELRKLGA